MTVAESQEAALARLEAIVGGVVPLRRPDTPFVVHSTGDGREVPLASLAHGLRRFEWDYARFPTRDSSRVTCRVDHSLVLRIRYDLSDMDRTSLTRLIAVDLVTVDDALRVPAAWQAGTTGILALRQEGDPGVDQVSDRVWIVGVPYTLILEACC